MQGQGSSSSSFPETFYFGHGVNANDLGLDQHNMVLDASAQGNTTILGEYSSSVSIQNQFSFQRQHYEDDWDSSLGGHVRSEQSFEESNPERNIAPLQESVNMSLVSGHVRNGQAASPGLSSHALPHHIDLNATYEGNGNDANQDMGAGQALDPLKPGGSESDQNQPARNSSNPLIISSGIAEYVLEENHGIEGPSNDSRHLSCKRRAPEDASGQLSVGGSSSSAPQAGNTKECAVTRGELVNAGLGFGMQAASFMHQASSMEGNSSGMGAAIDTHQTLSVATEAENFQRNIRLRIANQLVIPESPSLWMPRNSDVQSSHQVAPPLLVHATPAVQPFVQVLNSTQNLQPSQVIGATRSGGGVSSISPAHTINGGDAEENLRNHPRRSMLPPDSERRNLASRANVNLVNGNMSIPGNIASASRNSSSSGVSFPSATTGFPQPNMAEEYEQRVTDILNHTAHARQGNYGLMPLGASAAVWIMEVSSTGGNARLSQVPLRSGMMMRAERQSVDFAELPPAFRYLAAAERSRLISEDVSIINRSGLHGVPEEEDEDIRLDVDNMTYEELLDLEENIGNVCVGLSEEAILENLRRHKYQYISVWPPVEDEQCCICQEYYDDGEDLGKLDCGHDFHFSCIKQWLMQKNSCPICTMTALAVRDH